MIQYRYIILSILIVIIILQIYIIAVYNTFKSDKSIYKSNTQYKSIYLSDLKSYFKTGDLLFYSFNDVDIISRGFNNNRFSHIGMVYEKNKKLYIIEVNQIDYISPYTNKAYKNFNILPLDERIKNYSGTMYYSSLINELTPHKKNKLDYLINNALNYKYPNILNFLYRCISLSNKIDSESRFCSEFIAELLHELDISSVPYNSIKFKLSDTIVSLTNNNIYTNPVLILVDDIIIKNIKDSKYLTYC